MTVLEGKEKEENRRYLAVNVFLGWYKQHWMQYDVDTPSLWEECCQTFFSVCFLLPIHPLYSGNILLIQNLQLRQL